MPSAQPMDYSAGSPPRDIRTVTRRGSNMPSPRATPPCVTSFFAGRRPCQPTLFRVFRFTSALSPRRFRSLLAKDGYTQQMTASSCSSVNCPPPFSQSPVGRAACLLNDEPIPIYGHCSCPLGLFRPVIRLIPATPRILCVCSNVCFWRIGINMCTQWWLRNWPSAKHRLCFVFSVSPAPFLRGDSGACWQRAATRNR